MRPLQCKSVQSLTWVVLFFSSSGYIAMFIHPYTWTFYTASVLVGIGAAGEGTSACL